MYPAKLMIAKILVATATLLALPGSSFAELTELLGKLQLSGYARRTIAPEFSGRTVDGRIISLGSQRGKVVLLNFWATWCTECRAEMPMFEQLHYQFATQGLSVVGINAREEAASVRAYAKELRLTFPLALDLNGEINAAYGIVGLPATFLVGRDGRAMARAIGPREWNSALARKLIQELLAEGTAKQGSQERNR